MKPGARPPTLARHHLRWLAALYGVLVVVVVGAALVFVLWPMGRRATDDLAGLMQLAAQTWTELPPDTRPAFEAELLRAHRIAVQPALPASAGLPRLHGFYIGFLEDALERHQGRPRPVSTGAGPTPGEWWWAELSAGERHLAVGFERARLATRPLFALAVVLTGGSLALVLVAGWLARRIAEPVTRLEAAAAAVADGHEVPPLPETGPAELARLAAHFNTMTHRVRELLEARTTLLAGVSHDLRTPLARMRLALEMLRLKPGDEALLARLESDVDAMNALIGQMLELARGLGHEPAARFAARPWLIERVRAATAGSAPVGIDIDVQAAQDLALHAAPGLLARVVDNLLGNALRHAVGPIELVAEARDDGVRIEVRDRGPGIPPEQIDAAWRPFQRIETSRSPMTGGYGLGLAIVRQLAQSQHWPVGLHNRDGGGLCAWVRVPRADS